MHKRSHTEMSIGSFPLVKWCDRRSFYGPSEQFEQLDSKAGKGGGMGGGVNGSERHREKSQLLSPLFVPALVKG